MYAPKTPEHYVMPAELPSILILGDHFGYADGVVHGVTTYYLNVLPALVARGVDLHACFLREPHPAAAALNTQGIETLFLSASKWNFLVAFEVAAIIRRYRCHVVHAAGLKATVVGRAAARMTGAEVIVHAHDLLYPNVVVGALHRTFARSSDMGLGVSNAVLEVLANGYHVEPQRCRVLHNGIPLEHVRSVSPAARSRIRAELGVPAESGVIAMIARMHPIKGHASMLRIMACAVRSIPSLVLVLAGDGPERAACEALVVELGLQGNVRFLGSRTDIPDLLAASDVVVVPSKSEGLSLVAIEAAAAGRPVVAFDIGGLPDVVSDGVNGYLIKPGDEEGFAKALLDLFGNPQRRAEFGAAALVGVDHFSLENHVDDLLKCYRELATPQSKRVAAQSASGG